MDECQTLDDLLAGARAGRSAALVLRGAPGIGKTELLKHVHRSSSDCRVLRAAGVESEMELSYAGLHQLCMPLLTGLDRLPKPQAEALATAFGMRAGPAPDQFFVALAALSLLADAASTRPLVCLIDDSQWLDQASALTLGFVARRLLAESVVLVFAGREPAPAGALTGLPELHVTRLSDHDARALLASVTPGPFDPHVHDRLLAEADGNPLALLELPRSLTAAELAGGLVGAEARPLPVKLEEGFQRRIESLPADARLVLSIAAAEPFGDATLLRRAAERIGIDIEAAIEHADVSELITLGTKVRFRHPLVRSAVYRAASASERREAHRVLAESIDIGADLDLRAWHSAQAATGPDEGVAAELQQSAERARARGSNASVAAFLERATALTPDPAERARRALDAAQAKLQAGEFDAAAGLLAIAESGPPDELRLALAHRLRAQIAFAQNRGEEAPPLLLAAARRLEQIDLTLARDTYLEAVLAAVFAGPLARGPGIREVIAAARSAPRPEAPELPDDLLQALAVSMADGYSAAADIKKRVLQRFRDDTSDRSSSRWVWLAEVIAADLWDDHSWDLLATRHVTITRNAGALTELPHALDSRSLVHILAGELAAGAALIGEVDMVSEAIGSQTARVQPLVLASFRGREREARSLIDTMMSEAVPRGQGAAVVVTHWARAVLCNGLARYEEALAAASEAAASHEQFGVARWALPELVEAAAYSNDRELASDTLEQLSQVARASGTEWALGLEARSRALLSPDGQAEQLSIEAIERLGRTQARVDLARAHLTYGEWLRREGRRTDARVQLTTAHEMLTQFGLEAFAGRAERELRATGATIRRKQTIASKAALTTQEEQIARLAGEGLTNPEIGARLFLSPHTVEWHLRKVFQKLGISSRREISAKLPRDSSATTA
ncbi:AAA family ATPase [Nocardioides sp. NBC_00368]